MMKKLVCSLWVIGMMSTPLSAQEAWKIEILVDNTGEKIIAVLDNNATAKDFYHQLPLSFTLTDYANSEKIAHLPQRLSTQNAPRSYEGKQGDLTYYAPWGNLAIFYRDSQVGKASGLVYFGHIQSGLNSLKAVDGETVTIRQVKD